jgi:topoisomerase-4 subunit A
VAATHTQVACLSMDGRLLVYPLDELKLQPGGGKGLTLMDVDAAEPLLSVATIANSLLLQGSGRGGKPREETLKWAGLAEHLGKRARKGRKVEGFVKLLRVLAL